MEQAARGRLRRAAWLAAVFALAFLVRSLYAVDQAPDMYTPEQTGTRMAQRYDSAALGILAGEGILWPRVRDKERTGLLARPPGYALYLALVYATIGHSFFAAQLLQNLLTSLACVLLVLAATRLASWPAAVVAGVIAGLSPALGYVSALVLPDALSALPLMIALLLVAKTHPVGTGSVWTSALAGALVGAGVWLRPNVVLLPPFLSLVILLVARDRRRGLLHAVALSLAAIAVVIPITIRNYVVFGAFVPVSINGGLTLWQGVADAGGREVGAKRHDTLVAEEEAVRYGESALPRLVGRARRHPAGQRPLPPGAGGDPCEPRALRARDARPHGRDAELRRGRGAHGAPRAAGARGRLALPGSGPGRRDHCGLRSAVSSRRCRSCCCRSSCWAPRGSPGTTGAARRCCSPFPPTTS